METRVCSKCGKKKDLTKDNLKVVKSAQTCKKHFSGSCKECYYKQTNEARRKRKKAKAEERRKPGYKTTETRHCKKCNKTKSILEFSPSVYYCKPCMSAYAKERYGKIKSERQSQYEKENKTGLRICKICNTEKKLIFH